MLWTLRRTRIGHHCCAVGSPFTWPTTLSGNAISACNGRSFGCATPPTTPVQPSPHPSAQWGEPVNHLPIDPDAHSRRAWLPWPNCNHGHGCPQCQNNHNCQIHWQYLLKTAGTRVSLQCPICAHLWTVDAIADEVDGHGRQAAGPSSRRFRLGAGRAKSR